MPSSSGDRHRSYRDERERSGSRESSKHRSGRDDRSSSHSSSSRRDHKYRRRSRSPKEERDRESHKSTVKMIEEAKNKMRAGLAAADAGSTAASTASVSKAASSASALETASRHREIELIDSDRGFVPQSFLSSAGGKKPLIDGDHAAELEKQDEHENAIFGQIASNKGETTNDSESKQSGAGAYSKRPPCPLAHENLSVDPKMREEKWLKNWRAMRAKMLIN